LINNAKSLTGKYLKGELKIESPAAVRKWKRSVVVEGARQNNLNNITVELPLGVLCVISGVSGSGKTTLIKQIVYPALKKLKGEIVDNVGMNKIISADLDHITQVEQVDQNHFNKSSRSIPVTYITAYDEIRVHYDKPPLSK